MKLLQLVSIFTFTSSALAGCRNLRIEGDGLSGRLECQSSDGTWGTVCSTGFNSYAAKAACRELGYYGSDYTTLSRNGYNGYSSNLPVVVCYTNCDTYDSQPSFRSCSVQYTSDGDCSCTHGDDIILSCSEYPRIQDDDYDYTGYDDSTDSSGSSAGAIVGVTIGGMAVFGIVVLLVICRVYVRYTYLRRRNAQTYIVTQQSRPRILIASLTRTTTTTRGPLGPPPPPPYAPAQPTSGYTPVPPRGYQPVATDGYTTTPSVPPSDVPSEPPPEYTTPSASTNDVPMLTVQ